MPEPPHESIDETTVAALERLLRRAEAGERIALDALRAEYPANWEELHALLVLEGWMRHDAKPPRRIGSFRVVRRLGAGGTAVAYVAEAVEPAFGLAAGERACLKVLGPRALSSPRALDRMQREARVGATVRHRNVVRVLGLDIGHGGDDGAVAYLVQECVDGETLRERVAEDGPLDDAACRRLVREVASGLAAIHAAGAVHRDIKPDNVLLDDADTARILDLGVVRIVGQSTAGAGDHFVGSLRYASPEQFTDGGRVSPASDLFALGLLAWEAATGTPAFPQPTASSLRDAVVSCDVPHLASRAPGVSPFLAALVHALLRADPGTRLGPAERVAEIATEGESGAWWREVAGPG